MQPILPLQFLRAAAALIVAIGHFQFFVGTDLGRAGLFPDPTITESGVDLFFVISGFVMVYAGEPLFGKPGGARQFFERRLIRIVPIYWLVTTLYLAAAIALPQFNKAHAWDFVLASYLFFPYAAPDGVVQPLVGQGWTLNYEMFFYVIFALAMLAGSRAKAIGIAAAVLVAFYLLGKLVTPLPTALAFWSGSIALEFIFGMLIALAYRRGVRLPRWACYALLLAGPLLALAFWYYPTGSRPFGWGIAASAIVAGAVFGDFAPGRRWKFLSAVGDASYALYLIHAVPIRLFLMAVVALGLDIGKAPWLYLVLAVAGTVLLALAIYYLFERPLTVALRNRIGAPRPAAAAGSSRAPGKTRAIW